MRVSPLAIGVGTGANGSITHSMAALSNPETYRMLNLDQRSDRMNTLHLHPTVPECDQAALQDMLADHPTSWMAELVQVKPGPGRYTWPVGNKTESTADYYLVTFYQMDQVEPFHRCVILKTATGLHYPYLTRARDRHHDSRPTPD